MTVARAGFVLNRSRRNSGVMLKYPAVNVQTDPAKVLVARAVRIVRTAGSSVDLSGCKRGVNCIRGYTTVDEESESGVGVGGAWRSGRRTPAALALKADGFSKGEGAGLVVGHSILKLPSPSGRIEKLRLHAES